MIMFFHVDVKIICFYDCLSVRPSVHLVSDLQADSELTRKANQTRLTYSSSGSKLTFRIDRPTTNIHEFEFIHLMNERRKKRATI